MAKMTNIPHLVVVLAGPLARAIPSGNTRRSHLVGHGDLPRRNTGQVRDTTLGRGGLGDRLSSPQLLPAHRIAGLRTTAGGRISFSSPLWAGHQPHSPSHFMMRTGKLSGKPAHSLLGGAGWQDGEVIPE